VSDAEAKLRSALADRYAIQHELGRGGMATVYLAEDLKHHRPVAIKVLKPELATALGPDRFLREIELTAQLHHPNILPLYDSGSATAEQGAGGGEFLFYVMPFVEGESLRDRLERERQLPLDDALQITKDVAEALGYAHSRGVIHRDIKPENILLESGRALVADFGIAKAVSDAGGERLTGTGVSIGTPAYMSPEQAEAAPVDPRTDLYSLGCVLYEMLAGHPPFVGTTAHEMLVRHASDPVPPLRSARGTVPEPIEDAIEKVLSKVPADRFATAQQFGEALNIDTVGYRRRRRRTSRVRTFGLAAVGLVGAAAIWTWAAGHPEPREAAAADPFPVTFDSSAIAVLPFRAIGADSGSPARELAQVMGDLFELKVTGAFGRRIAHPGSVRERWQEAGGTLATALSESRELQLGRDLAVGALVRGTVVVSDSGLTVAGQMIDVVTGNVRVPTVHVDGPLERRYDLVDQLIVLLLARDAGWSPEAAPRLAHYKPEAVQAYMAGGGAVPMSAESKRYYRMALEADSSLVEAALWAYAEGEDARDLPELRYALEHQDQLSERGRAYVRILAGKAFGTLRTAREVIAAYEGLAQRWPEWSAPWVELGQMLVSSGALASVPNWQELARAAFERAPQKGTYGLLHLAELAFLQEDTAWAKAATLALPTKARSGSFIGEMPTAYPWRLAVMLGDSAGAARALGAMANPFYVFSFAYADGRGMAEADRVAATSTNTRLTSVWAWARGRSAAYWDVMGRRPPAFTPNLATVFVWNAVLRHQPPDSLTTEALEFLEQVASGRSGNPPPTAEQRSMAAWWTAMWRLQHGDTTSARSALRDLEATVAGSGEFVGCERMLDALVRQVTGGDVRDALLRMDSVVRLLPQPNGFRAWYVMPVEVQNLFLARELARYGEPERALAASRRRFYGGYAHFFFALPEYLREEGRLAALVGDTAGALRAYNHYLALREDPDQPWRPQWDSVRMELEAILRTRR